MNYEEFIQAATKILGIKVKRVDGIIINMLKDDHLDQRISLGLVPTQAQAKKLKDIAFEYGAIREVGEDKI